ncbi:glycosyltransferase family 9 protein [Shewanella japonica]|uniref:glycosyltransferase family 9 protein n=1 Tax=Shewanella japonica TaxID=93973 RepID=UPI003B8A944C
MVTIVECDELTQHVDSPDSVQLASRLVEDLSLSNVELVKGITSFESVIPIIRNSELLISVDTSLVHVSKVLNKGVVAIFPETMYAWKTSSVGIVSIRSSIAFALLRLQWAKNQTNL